MEFKESYLKNVLESKRELRVLSMANENYAYILYMLSRRYQNLNIDVIKGETSALKVRENTGLPLLDNPNLIILYSSFIEDEEKLEILTDRAKEISRDTGKRVTIGYAYIIPWEDRPNTNAIHEVRIVSIKDGDTLYEYGEVIPTEPYFGPYDLLDMTLQVHDELNNQFKRQRKGTGTI